MFADRYIKNNIVHPTFIEMVPFPAPEMIVVIPCLNEPEIIRTLDSLWRCERIQSFCEVIVVVNDSENSSRTIKNFNAKTFQSLLDWKIRNDRPHLVLHPIYASEVFAKHAGAGMARKIGMDEAVRRFSIAENTDGVIVSLDADCLVSENYLKRIESEFSDNNCFAANLNFQHRIDEVIILKQKEGILLYENYLHYYKKALDFAGFPNSIYTIGSAFAVRADAYVKQGGMNRRQAGEDFYFLHKLTQLGKITEIQDAFVYPSARVSNRVPFGTGAAMTKWMEDACDLSLTYNFAAFSDLKLFFGMVKSFYKLSPDKIEKSLSELPLSIIDYLSGIPFQEKLLEINRNSSSEVAFLKRFFQFFDGLTILRYLNQVHETHFKFQKLTEATELLNLSGE